jgi:ATP-binding protein involved in chromosome partitioning
MMSSEALVERVWDALRQIRFPGYSRDIVSFGFVRGVELEEGRIKIELVMETRKTEAAEAARAEVKAKLEALPEIQEAEVSLAVKEPERDEHGAHQAVSREPDLLPGVEHVVAVASGKGGVGKSTVASNLAVRMAQLGHRVGLLDGDIYGPSMPLMFHIEEPPRIEGHRVRPFEKFGVKLMSLGFVLEKDTPVIWRGPMVMKALEQLLGDVMWGELDYLIVDMPPGTGDAHLTLTQKVPLAGAVIVTTPQDVALVDARKGLVMFEKVNVPVVGIIENMSSFVCPHCGKETEIFKRGGGEKTADELGCPFLGRVPLDPVFVEGGDSGVPAVVSNPDGAHAEAFAKLAESVVAEVAKSGKKWQPISIE